MKEFSIDSIRRSPENPQPVVVLREKGKENIAARYIAIWIHPPEADSIAVTMRDIKLQHPLTHDLILTLLQVLDAQVEHVVVDDLQNETYRAKIYIRTKGETKPIDCRPSDALAIAARTQSPIFVKQSVLEQTAFFMDPTTGRPITR